MKFYSDFNEMYAHNTGLKCDLSIFNSDPVMIWNFLDVFEGNDKMHDTAQHAYNDIYVKIMALQRKWSIEELRKKANADYYDEIAPLVEELAKYYIKSCGYGKGEFFKDKNRNDIKQALLASANKDITNFFKHHQKQCKCSNEVTNKLIAEFNESIQTALASTKMNVKLGVGQAAGIAKDVAKGTAKRVKEAPKKLNAFFDKLAEKARKYANQ